MENEFYTFPAPSINELTPNYGRGGDTVAIMGTHLASVETCIFQVGPESVSADIVGHDADNQLKVLVPQLPPGNGVVSVSNNGGESNKIDFTVQ